MEGNRIKQILSSSNNVKVEFEGISVWIESFDEQTQNACVHDVDFPEEHVTVSANDLKEV
ncbi:MAG: Small acid-soluble spore protein family [Bacillales bacterium]|jgi:small acid-soluble spore protein H (minor)|nr:Small acid-soluble spore protein family [Bacillales bacterium]